MTLFDPILFGKRVRQLRTAQSLSLRDLAGTLKLSPSTIHRIENAFAPDVETFLVLSKWLGDPPPPTPVICTRCDGKGFV